MNITDIARKDLIETYKYIANELMSPQVAKKQLERIEKAIYSLDIMPTRHRIYDEKINSHIRFLPINNYIIFYTINQEELIVDIVRVLYGGRDFSNKFN